METDKWLQMLQETLVGWGSDETVAVLASHAIGVVSVVALAIFANWAVKAALLRIIGPIVHRTPWKWDDVLLDHGVFTRLSHLAPAFVIKIFGSAVFGAYGGLVAGAVQVYVLVILWMIFSAFLNALQAIFEKTDEGANVPVKGFVQAVKLVMFLIIGILVMSVIFGRSPVYFLSGLGAATAVMMLIFRDALLGLVAGVMISVNRMVRVGDWIDMPSNGADGDVLDVSLTTVKVRNWDRTITTIPSYDLISKSFKNYHGMYESKGRRIKRALNIDMQTIRFVDEELLEHFKKVRRLRPYLESKVKEIEEANAETGLDLDSLCNGRRLTNIGTFR
ncbi:MAG: mechanosensitive ion channel family protein, partial [Opitutales bacterium]|nr:mechanosensitive ion channel family protein [Opitutales bacterium]